MLHSNTSLFNSCGSTDVCEATPYGTASSEASFYYWVPLNYCFGGQIYYIDGESKCLVASFDLILGNFMFIFEIIHLCYIYKTLNFTHTPMTIALGLL